MRITNEPQIGSDYRIDDTGIGFVKFARVLYFAEHNATKEKLVGYCYFNLLKDDCKSSDVVDNVIFIPVSQFIQIASRVIK